MIVIATNNGHEYLKNLLNSMEHMDLCGEDLLIVDTMSDNQYHLDFLSNVKQLYPHLNINVVKTPYRKFDTGAYVYAYKNFHSENYVFLHDSITIKDNSFIKVVIELLKNYDVISFSCFDFAGYGDDEWRQFFNKNTGKEKYEIGIFGPMFSCKKSVLDKIELEKLELPNTKNQQACFEGIWPVIFEQNSIEVFCMNKDGIFQSKYLDKRIVHRN